MIERWLDWERRLTRGKGVMKKMGLIHLEGVKIGEQTFPIFDSHENETHGRAYLFRRNIKTGMILSHDFFGGGLGYVKAEWSELWDHPGAVVRASNSGQGKDRFDEVRINLAVARDRIKAGQR